MSKKIMSVLGLLTVGLVLTSCKEESGVFYGYVEAKYLYVSSYVDGIIEEVYVSKGSTVSNSTPLFKVDGNNQKYDSIKYTEIYNASGNTVADMKKGKRIELLKSWDGVINALKSLSDGAKIGQKVVQSLRQMDAIKATSNLQTTQMMMSFVGLYDAAVEYGKYLNLGDRPDKIAAYINLQNAAEADMNNAKWNLAQITQNSPTDALVFDTLYQKGEFVNKGKPVVVLLPPDKIKARFYVNGDVVNTLKLGQAVKVSISGVNNPIDAKIVFIAPNADYTEPFLYTLKSNNKYVYMVDAEFSKLDSAIHPGQPIEVTL